VREKIEYRFRVSNTTVFTLYLYSKALEYSTRALAPPLDLVLPHAALALSHAAALAHGTVVRTAQAPRAAASTLRSNGGASRRRCLVPEQGECGGQQRLCFRDRQAEP
jgi:hypothetical protein